MNVSKQNKMRLQMSKISSHNVRKEIKFKIIKYRKTYQTVKNLFITQH